MRQLFVRYPQVYDLERYVNVRPCDNHEQNKKNCGINILLIIRILPYYSMHAERTRKLQFSGTNIIYLSSIYCILFLLSWQKLLYVIILLKLGWPLRWRRTTKASVFFSSILLCAVQIGYYVKKKGISNLICNRDECCIQPGRPSRSISARFTVIIITHAPSECVRTHGWMQNELIH